MKNQNQADLRWTVRFSTEDDLVCTRKLIEVFARLDRVTMGRFLRLAIEQRIDDRFGRWVREAATRI